MGIERRAEQREFNLVPGRGLEGPAPPSIMRHRAVDDVRFKELRFRVRAWRAGALELSSPQVRSTELGRGRDAGIALGY